MLIVEYCFVASRILTVWKKFYPQRGKIMRKERIVKERD